MFHLAEALFLPALALFNPGVALNATAPYGMRDTYCGTEEAAVGEEGRSDITAQKSRHTAPEQTYERFRDDVFRFLVGRGARCRLYLLGIQVEREADNQKREVFRLSLWSHLVHHSFHGPYIYLALEQREKESHSFNMGFFGILIPSSQRVFTKQETGRGDTTTSRSRRNPSKPKEGRRN
jgi:hypothetical protein